ncbi:MAG TPA: CbtA family protein [Tabrizicola sp.]|nr:CbtA family protein [Tabrizicola sp.]
MIQRMLTSALVAGCAAWLLAAVLHFAFVQKYILLGEAYETGAAVHYAGVVPADGHADAGHSHDEPAAEGHSHDEGAAAHDHGDAGAVSTGTRTLWTTVFFGLVYVAYALILVAGFGLARAYGKIIAAREGLLWGIAGFASFQLVPAMGLAPELPGTLAADLGARQVWWWGTVAATAVGLGLLGYGRSLMATALAVVLLAVPHLVGAPELDGFSGVAPPEVAGAFSARVLGTGLAVWALMGWVAGHVWARTPDNAA